MFHVCYAVLSVPCRLVVTCWERAGLLALLCVMFSCVFVTFPYGVQGQVWYLVVKIPDRCLLPYFVLSFAEHNGLLPLVDVPLIQNAGTILKTKSNFTLLTYIFFQGIGVGDMFNVFVSYESPVKYS